MTTASDDVEAFFAGSPLGLAAGRRVLAHLEGHEEVAAWLAEAADRAA